MKDFTSLPKTLFESLTKMQILTPTPVQSQAIPIALTGTDILASAHTGSGKTLAYLVPLLVQLTSHLKQLALILTPTRELAIQVEETLLKLIGSLPSFKSALLIGGASMSKQLGALKRKPNIIIGTPGRIMDHLGRKTLSLKETKFLVIDEMDRMLDMGFGPQIDKILEHSSKNRQTLMFSATVPANIEKAAQKYLQNPRRIEIDNSLEPSPEIHHEVIHTTPQEKFQELVKQLNEREGSILVFTRTKRGADRLSQDLKDGGHSSHAIHGDLSQRRRESVLKSFRNSTHRILVATDIAARGLDIPHIRHVINYDLPDCHEDYIHRIGRTARAGKTGHALCLIAGKDKGKWKGLSKFMETGEKPAEEVTHNSLDRPRKHKKTKKRFSPFRAGLKKSRKKMR